ncbi:MAG: protein-glutamate O-methyltransferase CheR [Desulfobacterota bacterium]|nr:protein-glutamate O-methyltransferase CheR [Thermodesulfobacteriota bacterium]
MRISDTEFNLLRKLVYERFGINLTEAKKSLVVSRLQKTIRSLGMRSFKQYYDYLMADTTGSALDTLINRISTNHTFFYRESNHFEFFRSRVLPEMSSRIRTMGCRDLRIWCAGCSSGEEAYTLIIEMKEFFGSEYDLWDAGLLATDISTNALQKAVTGEYTEDNVAHLPAYARRYFKKISDDRYRVSDELKREITFRRFNLMTPVFPFRKPFHVIFCRNVMIYFDQMTRSELIRKFYQCLVPEGYLFIGHSESLGREQTLFQYIMPAVYRKKQKE